MEQKPPPTPALSLFLEWLLLVFLFALMARRGVFIPFRSDSNGYEAAAWMLSQGQLVYSNFIHSQGPLFLWWGQFFSWVLQGNPFAYRLSASVCHTLAMGIGLLLVNRFFPHRPLRLGLVAGFFFNPILLWEAWYFVGVSESLLGLMLCLYGLLGRAKPVASLVGLGGAIALTARLLPAPAVVILLVACLLRNRRMGLLALCWLVGTWSLLMLPVWIFGGFMPWWSQSFLYHLNKDVVFLDRWAAYARNLVFLLPLSLPLISSSRLQKTSSVEKTLILGVGLSLAGALTQEVFTTYYLLPAAVLTFALVLSRGSFWKWLMMPMVALGLWQVASALRPFPPEGNVPGINHTCQTLQNALPAGSYVFSESTIAWPVLRCGRFRVWEGMTDTNLMVFQNLISIEKLVYLLKSNPPASVVLMKTGGLWRVPLVQKTLKMHYRLLPQPKESMFTIWLPR